MFELIYLRNYSFNFMLQNSLGSIKLVENDSIGKSWMPFLSSENQIVRRISTYTIESQSSRGKSSTFLRNHMSIFCNRSLSTGRFLPLEEFSINKTITSVLYMAILKNANARTVFLPFRSNSNEQVLWTKNWLKNIFLINNLHLRFSSVGLFPKSYQKWFITLLIFFFCKFPDFIPPMKVSIENATPVQLISIKKHCYCILGLDFW